MQKFKVALKNVPTNAPQVRSSTNPVLNRVQRLSVQGKVRTLNNLDVDLLQHKGGRNSVSAVAYVLNMQGKPLMPCKPRMARILLKRKEAKVITCYPFTIQLNRVSGSNIQVCYLNIDSGSKEIGYSALTDAKELEGGELKLDQRTSERLTERRMYRKSRRNKLWHREARFNNRSIPKGWLPPSVQRKFDTHITFIKQICRRLPIDPKNITIEVGNFDIQKIENPDIKGIQYQQGSMFEYENMRYFLMAREHGKCQLCGKEFSKGNGSHIHHITPKGQGGSDREKNLALLHKKCHTKLHKNKLFDSLKKNKTYKDSAFMSIVRHRYREALPDCNLTYGNETSVKRYALHLEKTHYNDAFAILGTNQTRSQPTFWAQKHRNNRAIQQNRKGFKPAIRRQRYSIQPYDLVLVDNKIYSANGCFDYGTRVRCNDGCTTRDFSIKKIKKVFHTNSIYQIDSWGKYA